MQGIIIIAISLSLDAFTSAMCIGASNMEKKNMFIASLSVGLFHFFMPLIGSLLSMQVIKYIPIEFDYVIGFIFVILAFQIIRSYFLSEENNYSIVSISTILLFSLAVSLDSLIVGVTLTHIYPSAVMAALVFSIVSFTFTYVGMLFGAQIYKYIGKKAELLGAILLLILAISVII